MTSVDEAQSERHSLAQRVRHFLELRILDRQVKDRLKDIREELAGWVESNGYYDERGHIVWELPEPVDGITKLIRQRRATQTLNEQRAEALLKERGLWERCTRVVRVIDEEELAAVVFETSLLSREALDEAMEQGGDYLTEDDFNGLLDTHVTFVGPLPA